MGNPLTAFIVTRACECGRALWGVMGDAPNEVGPLLVTICVGCDLAPEPGGLTYGSPDDRPASAEKE